MNPPFDFTIVLIVVSIVKVFAQDDGPQMEDLIALRNNRNTTLVGSCAVPDATNISCALIDPSLIVSGSVFLQRIEIRIRTCNSSLWPIFTYSNGTQVADLADNLQCNKEIPLGQLQLFIDVNVSIDTTSTTIIRTSVHVCLMKSYITMFRSTVIELTAQSDENCRGGITPPPTTCDSKMSGSSDTRSCSRAAPVSGYFSLVAIAFMMSLLTVM